MLTSALRRIPIRSIVSRHFATHLIELPFRLTPARDLLIQCPHETARRTFPCYSRAIRWQGILWSPTAARTLTCASLLHAGRQWRGIASA